MTLAADTVYAKSRTDLDQFERAAFAALRSFVPNFFKDGRDDTIWGQHLRGIATQMARIDFQTHYLVHGADPAYLTPADLLRRYAAPLHLNRNYPGTTQLDADFKVMVLKLLAAYRMGATAKSIEEVIRAYTGESYIVEELFKDIGGFYDQSDRNAIRIGVKLTQGSQVKAITDVSRVRDLVTDLYTAIDLAKPAHVGVNLTTVMEEDPDPIILAITDDLRITILMQEGEPLDPMLSQAPFFDPATPDTGLAPSVLHLTYRWYKNGVVVGGNSTKLTLTAITIADDGSEIWAEATDPILGKVWSKKAVLSVHDGAGNGHSTIFPQRLAPTPPTDTLYFKLHPFSRIALAGSDVEFNVSVENTVIPGLLSPRLNLAWEIQSDSLHGLDLD